MLSGRSITNTYTIFNEEGFSEIKREMEGEREAKNGRVKETACWTEVCTGLEFSAVYLDPEQPYCQEQHC